MPTFKHTWTARNYPQDYAQTMALAKLLVGCPVDPAHRCRVCLLSMNREVKRLYRATYPVIEMPHDAIDTYRRVTAKNMAHRKFLQLWEATGKSRQSIGWYARHAGVTRWIAKQWIDREKRSHGKRRPPKLGPFEQL